jgi:hypothetical protein
LVNQQLQEGRNLLNSQTLLLSQIPSADAEWVEIVRFAHTFNGDKYWGSRERCSEIANARQMDTLEDLRTCLFFEQRRWNHFGEAPDANAMRYIRSLISQIRAKVSGPEVSS